MDGGRYVPSLLAAIGEVIERHLIEIGFLAAPTEQAGGFDARCGGRSRSIRCGFRTPLPALQCDPAS